MRRLADTGKNWKESAYTLAEMLIVMAIIMLIILSLPMATKKVFKLDDMRKSHGRYECYWETQEDGSKKLMTYMAEENGRAISSESAYADEGKCVFSPPQNTIYFMIHAVGGGGAGAKLTTDKAQLAPVEQVSAVSYLYKSSPGLFPDWVKFVMSKPESERPWKDKISATGDGAFDVNKVSFQQTVRYRLGGTAAKVVSLFVPQLPGNVKLELTPGKGGKATTNGDGSGEDGGDTIVEFVYEPGEEGGAEKRFEGLVARGGVGGNGGIDGKISEMMIGSNPGDFGLSSLASITGKDAGFSDITESAEKFDALKTKISYDAGAGGNGETQFVDDTSGYIFYEWDNNDSIVNARRIGSKWEVITDSIGLNFYRNYGYTSNCTDATESSVVIEREGYCTPQTAIKFDCTIGTNTSTLDTSCPDPSNCSHFVVNYDYGTSTATFADDTPNPTAYSPTTKFYNCEFNVNTFRIRCKTQLQNVKVHKCTTPSGTFKCANGETPTGSGRNMKCEAKDGGDGAVVILW